MVSCGDTNHLHHPYFLFTKGIKGREMEFSTEARCSSRYMTVCLPFILLLSLSFFLRSFTPVFHYQLSFLPHLLPPSLTCNSILPSLTFSFLLFLHSAHAPALPQPPFTLASLSLCSLYLPSLSFFPICILVSI